MDKLLTKAIDLARGNTYDVWVAKIYPDPLYADSTISPRDLWEICQYIISRES